MWALRDGTPVARLLGEGSPWTACALHGGALLTGAHAGVLGLFHLGGLVQQLDGAAVAAEQAAARAAAGEVPAGAAAGMADTDAARVSHDSAELEGDEAEDAAAEALQVQLEQLQRSSSSVGVEAALQAPGLKEPPYPLSLPLPRVQGRPRSRRPPQPPPATRTTSAPHRGRRARG